MPPAITNFWTVNIVILKRLIFLFLFHVIIIYTSFLLSESKTNKIPLELKKNITDKKGDTEVRELFEKSLETFNQIYENLYGLYNFYNSKNMALEFLA